MFRNNPLLLTILLILVSSSCNPSVCSCLNDICQYCLSDAFYLSSEDNICYLCDSNCQKCTSPSLCNTCSSGYYLNSQGECLECPLYCQQCSSSSTCTLCMDGYALNGETSQCDECALDNVLTCETTMTVQTCQDEYWKNGDSCSPCRQFCQQCTSSNNCLQCVQGYEPVISAGTYCTPCPTGCKTCSSSICSVCFANYRLQNSQCVSFEDQCQAITNCDECQYESGTISCTRCLYPYYLQSGSCVLGASLMCRSGGSDISSYSCLQECSQTQYSLSSPVSSENYICKPYLWVKGSDIVQYYYESPSSIERGIFEDGQEALFCGYSGIYRSQFSGTQNKVVLKTVFRPYYKLVIDVRAIPIYKTVDSSSEITLQMKMYDNLTNQYSQTIETSSDEACKPKYWSVQSKYIKDQEVTIEFVGTLLSSLSTGSFPNGLVAYSQILIHVYRCSSECRICSNSKYCIECYGDLFVYEHKCVSQCFGFFQFYEPSGDITNFTSKSCVQQCPSGFYSTLHPLKSTVYICEKCQSPCETCKDVGQCLSCVQPLLYYDLEYSCLTQCPNTHYSSSRTCVPCNSPCLTCTDESTCLSCSVGFFFEGQCLGVCPDGTYPDYTNKRCEQCGQKCQKCTNSANICSSCVSPYYLLATQCIEDCPATTYFPKDGQCIQCKAPCLKCTDEYECLSCLTGYLYNDACLQECPSGYFKNFTTSSCDQCNEKCLTCTSELICTSCVNETYLYRSSCSSDCPDRTYPSTQYRACVSCVSPCLTCNTSSYCFSCQIGYISGTVPGTCVRDCEDGYYPTEITISINNSTLTMTSKVCSPCAEQCLTCSKQTICLSCKNSSKVLNMNSCEDGCDEGYYESNGVCKVCSYPCLTCQNSSTSCLSCASPYILFEGSCISQCGLTYFSSNDQCIHCVYPCKRCTSVDSCLSCQPSPENNNQTYLSNTTCTEECPDGTYPDLITLKCKKCSYPCQTCTSSRVCLSCASGYLNPLKSTCEMCPSTFYANQTSKQCEPCPNSLPNCEICTSSTICKYCQDGYYLYSSKCITEAECESYDGYYTNQQQMACLSCVLPCGNCVSQSLCLTCLTGFFLDQKCLLQCPSGYYSESQSKTCQLCTKEICQTCSGTATTCLSCNQTGTYPVLFVSNQTCIKSKDCPQMYYLDSSFGYERCLKCQSPCEMCNSATQCLSCLTGILMGTQCRTSCPQSYFPVQVEINGTLIAQCDECSDNCLRCRDEASFCVECEWGQYLQNYTCVANCSDGFYLNENSFECNECKSPCLTCISNSYCSSCINSQEILYYGQCISVCPDGTYQQSDQCIQCPEQCQLCKLNDNSTEVVCKKCALGLFMNSSFYGTCESACADDEYADQNTRDCYKCQIPCQSCSSGTQCVTCIDGYMIYDGDCVSGETCPSGSFKHPTEEMCLNTCPSGYYGDIFLRQCVEQCLYEYVKSTDGLCSQSCGQGQHIVDNKLCSQCGEEDCNNLLTMETAVKSIFNSLYLRIQFSTDVTINSVSEQNITIEMRQLKSVRRLLVVVVPISFSMQSKTSKTIWLKLSPDNSIPTSEIKSTLSSYYIFPGQVLQNINSTSILTSFDYYTSEQMEKGSSFKAYSQAVSIIMCILFLVNLVFNTGHFMYSMVDYFQLLFFLLFLNIDYPPILNNFFYGFRYSHYLFLPQIFKVSSDERLNVQEAPSQFGIIMSDVSFLNNTGHDFLILFISFGILALFKVIDLIIECRLKSNRVGNQIETVEGKSESSGNLSEEISKDEHGCFAKYVKIIVNRIKWNYFNDIVYIIYFYLMVFALSQTYDMEAVEGIHYASNIFAILFLVLGGSWPIFLAMMIRMKRSKIEEHREVFPQLKCFYGTMKSNSTLGLYLIPIQYTKKLIYAILFVYCSTYENFILGVIIMTSILFLTLTLIYRPYNSKIQLAVNSIFEVIFCGGCLGISIFVLTQTDLTLEQNMQAGEGIVAVFLILSLLLLMFNVGRLVLEGIKVFCERDIMAEFQDKTEDGSQPHTINQGDSNIRLNVKMKNEQTDKCQSDESSGFGIYLKKTKQPPPMLIKCVKGSQLNSSNEPDEENKSISEKKEEEVEEKKEEKEEEREEPISKISKEQERPIIFPELLEVDESNFEVNEH